ncbi:hypothetical protein [Streptomyces indiaensis]|uniref:hypothetical protein n=1 Tax=Streptomyces indiaensis TaxID=284033 RepID=UPI001F32DAF9|nr:hypothetical protein [Streptomyces indiaensis]MCF1649741.1 hypothetical protein [Streptomyces indiaensis]
MYSIVVVPPPTTEDERNPTPLHLTPGERFARGGPAHRADGLWPGHSRPATVETHGADDRLPAVATGRAPRVPGRPDRAGPAR